jgi:hypothetical protein
LLVKEQQMSGITPIFRFRQVLGYAIEWHGIEIVSVRRLWRAPGKLVG